LDRKAHPSNDDYQVRCQRAKQYQLRYFLWPFNFERPAWLEHEESGRSSAEHGAKKPAPNPLITVVITIAGKNVMNWTPTTNGSRGSRSTVATPTATRARA